MVNYISFKIEKVKLCFICVGACPLADSALDVTHPGVLVLLGGSMELIHLGRGGVTDEEHASLLIGYIPHYQVLKGKHWRFVLITQHRHVWRTREREEKWEGTVNSILCNKESLSESKFASMCVHTHVCEYIFLPDMERYTSGLSPAETPGCLSSVRPVYLHTQTHTKTQSSWSFVVNIC